MRYAGIYNTGETAEQVTEIYNETVKCLIYERRKLSIHTKGDERYGSCS